MTAKKAKTIFLLMAAAIFAMFAAPAVRGESAFSITVTAVNATSEIVAPADGITTKPRPTVFGFAQLGSVAIAITGTSGGSTRVVATTAADTEGYYAARVDETAQLDLGSNTLTPYANGVPGTPIHVTVTLDPGTDIVPAFVPGLDGRRFSMPRPPIAGNGPSHAECKLYRKDDSGLIRSIGSSTIGNVGNFTITPTEDFTAGKYEVFAVAGGNTSDMATVYFVDPYGTVYDSQTGEPVDQAQVLLQRSLDGGATWNDAVPGTDIDSGDINPLTTDASGMYHFLAAPGDFRLVVTRTGYTFPSSIVTMGMPNVGSHGERFTVLNEILQIGLPVDFAGQGLLKLAKTANKKEASVGDIVTYTVTIENDGAEDITAVYVKDRPPAGFKYLRGKVRLDGTQVAEPEGTRPLVFEIGNVAAGQTRTLSYQLVIGSGVTFGDYKNTAACIFSNGREISNSASASVSIVADPTFELGTILGKVFIDQNGNGVQDDDENPFGSVRLIMEDGTAVTTDIDGLYHIPGVIPGRHVLLLDERSLPKGVHPATRKAVIVDVTSGMPVKANFGVRIDQELFDASLMHRPFVVTQDSQRPIPRLNAAFYDLAQERQKYKGQHRYVFRIFTNYAPFIDTWRLTVIDGDTKAVLREFTGTQADIFSPIYWDGALNDGQKIDNNTNYAFVLRVRAAGGAEDSTVERELELKTAEEDTAKTRDRILRGERVRSGRMSLAEWLSSENGANNIENQRISVDGETVRLQTRDMDSAVVRVRYADGRVIELPAAGTQSIRPANDDATESLLPVRAGDVSTEVILPRGEYDIEVASGSFAGTEPNGNAEYFSGSGAAISTGTATGTANAVYSEHVRIGEDYMTLVAMGDAKTGYSFNSGTLEAISDRDAYKTGLWYEGKLAYYLKGRILGKYLITSSLDTDRDKKELFRRIQPDRYYPVYGDSSSINFDATDTQGRLYLLLEWDKSSIIWGNYNTELNDTELAQFNRTLYGGKVQYQSIEGTKFGEPVTQVTAFSSKPMQKAGHNEFMGTGGSLYYLKNRDIVEGSEKVTIEVRDKITGLTIASRSMSADTDYQINYRHGRILFWRPVSMVAQSDSIISTALLDGNKVYVVIDYEYEAEQRLGNDTSGVSGRQAVGDNVIIGGTYVKEQQLDKDYELKAADAKVHLSDTAVLKAEYAESTAFSTGNWLSDDGGLTFTEVQAGSQDQGKAYGISVEDHIGDRFAAKAYYKRIGEGFSSTGTTSQQGKEIKGAQMTYDLTKQTRLKLTHDEQELLALDNPQANLQVGANRTRTSIAQVVHREEDLTLTGEYRKQDVEGKISPFVSETNQQGDIVAGRIDYDLDTKTTVSLEQQVAVSGSANTQTTAGIVTHVNDKLDVRATQAVGSRGAATSVGAVARNSDKYELHTDYTVSDYGMGNAASIGGRMKQSKNTDTYGAMTFGQGGQTATVLGTRTRDDHGIETVMEREITSTKEDMKNTDIVGVSGPLAKDWRAMVRMEKGDVQKYDGTVVTRTSNSVGLGYSETDKLMGRTLLKTLTKLEIRSDHGDVDERQYVLYNMIESKPDSDTTLSASLQLSRTKNATTNELTARYSELVLGIAFRPVDWDSIIMLGKYTYLDDRGPSGQRGVVDIDDEKSHTISGELIYDLTDNWEIIGKAAFKLGKEKVSGFDWTSAEKLLLAGRLNYKFYDDWRIGLEYRRLSVMQADDVKQGVVIEVSRRVADYLDFGIGYNFTDFNDDLTRLNFRSQGPYIRLTVVLFN